MTMFIQAQSGVTPPPSYTPVEAQFVDANGKPVELGGSVPAATTDKAGVVKRAAAVSSLATGATLEQVVTAFNDLLAKGKAAGFLS